MFVAAWLELREIRVRVQRPGHRTHELRLWTSRLDPKSAPAQERSVRYARRWEHALYDRELKRPLRKSEVLPSHTVETGAQEIAAVVLARALLARARTPAAAGTERLALLRVSFVQTLELLRPLWLTLALGGDLLSARQKAQLTERFLERAGRRVTRRRPRRCPRAVRQPVSQWPRLRRNQSWAGPVNFQLLQT